jgi:predicted enzyme related to lactoylglutathione lyase
MFNFRVRDLDAMLKKLKQEGVQVMDKVQSFEYGKFGWIVDPEGNKIELWQPMNEQEQFLKK